MARHRTFPKRIVRLIVALLCWVQIGQVAHALPAAKSAVLCGHASIAAIESLAWLAPDEYGKSLRQMLGGDVPCQAHCAIGPAVLPPSGLTHASPRLSTVEPRQVRVALGASRFGRLRPPATAPPFLS